MSQTESSANWQEWCAGMDGLASLIMLAVSLSMACQ
jgi:UDP-N-acetylmuramyl pentapeptide phosphotransferase/UDP-N-acetylglucosamine-1-phosphate transferase